MLGLESSTVLLKTLILTDRIVSWPRRPQSK